jgi:hypothetical protein
MFPLGLAPIAETMTGSECFHADQRRFGAARIRFKKVTNFPLAFLPVRDDRSALQSEH